MCHWDESHDSTYVNTHCPSFWFKVAKSDGGWCLFTPMLTVTWCKHHLHTPNYPSPPLLSDHPSGSSLFLTMHIWIYFLLTFCAKCFVRVFAKLLKNVSDQLYRNKLESVKELRLNFYSLIWGWIIWKCDLWDNLNLSGMCFTTHWVSL